MACANANAPHTNGSQFFITLDRTDGLNKRNTIFGKVTGDTIYNLANMNELEVGEDDRRVPDDMHVPASACVNYRLTHAPWSAPHEAALVAATSRWTALRVTPSLAERCRRP